MNRILIVFLIFFNAFLFQTIKNASASHAAGAEMTYVYLDSNRYQITYTFYRNCRGYVAPPTINLQISSSCPPVAHGILSPISSSPEQILPLCPSAQSICTGGINEGIETWVYQGIVTLPTPCSDWIISYAESARNSAITTIGSFGTDFLFTYLLINNTTSGWNTGPQFIHPPQLSICVGEPICISHAAIDSDGDSLAYQLITPLTGIDTTVQYISGYSATQPLISNPPVSFDSLSGLMCMTPTNTDVTVYAVLVSEFRNGILIGQIERDVDLYITYCSNTTPLLTGINGTPDYSTNACPGIPLNFSINSFDPDSANHTSITWDTSITGGVLTTSGAPLQNALFSWTPNSSDVSTTPHCFDATVSDDHCPYYGSSSSTYCITVLPSSDAYCIALGMNSIENLHHLVIYPNPATENIQIKATHPGDLKIFDEAGRIVFQKNVTATEETKVDVSLYAKGIYQVLVNSPFIRSKGRFIVQ